MKSRLLPFIFLLLSLLPARAEIIRLAILADDEAQPVANLLTAQLSQSPGVKMVERDEIQRLAAEHQLHDMTSHGDFKGAGALLNANGLIVLNRDAQSKPAMATARLIAVEPGVVIDTMAFPVSNNPDFDAAAIQARFGPLLEKVHMQSGNAVAISLLGLRFDLDSLRARALENQLNRLVADRLIHEPGILVLERWRMEALAWEKSLTSAAAPFWTGSYLLEGSIHWQEKTLTLSVHLKRADGTRKEIQLSGSEENLLGIADELTARLKAEIGSTDWAPLPWNKTAEAENFVRLAEWAVANKLPGEALCTVESAVALGLGTPKVKALQIRAYAMFAYPDDLSVSNREYFVSKFNEENLPLNLEAATEAATLLTRFQRDQAAVPRPETFTLEHPEYLTPRVLMTAFRVLRRVHEARAHLERPVETAALRVAVQQAGSFLRNPSALPGGLELSADNIAFAPYWTDTPEQTLAVYKAAMETPVTPVGQGSPAELMRWQWSAVPVHYPCFDDPQLPNTAAPWLVAWKPEQEPRLPELWRDFVDELKRAPSLQAQIDGLAFEYHSTKQKAARLEPIADFLWKRRADIFDPKNRVTLLGLTSAIRVCCSASQTPSFLPNMLGYMLEARAKMDILTWEAFFHSNRKWTEEEAQALDPRLTAFEQSLPSAPTKDERRLRTGLASVHNTLWRQYPALAPQDAQRPGEVAVNRFWKPSEQAVLRDLPQDSRIGNPHWIDGKLWFTIHSDRAEGRICGVDPFSSDIVAFQGPNLPPNPAAQGRASGIRSLEVTPEAFFLADGAEVFRCNRASGQWKRLDLPLSLYNIRAHASGVFLLFPTEGHNSPSEGSGLLKFNPANDSYEVMISSRRIPPVSALDGKTAKPRDVFEDGKGGIYFWWRDKGPAQQWESQMYKWCEEQKGWEKVFSVDRFIRLKDERPGALIMTDGALSGDLGFTRFEQIILLNPASGQFELLLENPEAKHHPLNQPPRWEFPPELCRIPPNAARFHEMAWHNGVLWMLAYERKHGDDRVSNYELFAFLPGRKTAVQIPMRFASPEEHKKDAAYRSYHLPDGFVATSKGLIITSHLRSGFWLLPYSEIPQLSPSPISR